jgi:hypothetical protein
MFGPTIMARTLIDINAPVVLPCLFGVEALLIAVRADGKIMPAPMACI